MVVREKPDGWLEPEAPRAPRASVEREVGVSHVVDGAPDEHPHGAPGVHGLIDAAPLSPIEAAKRRTGHRHHERGRRRRKLRLALLAGAVVLMALPTLLRTSGIEGPRTAEGTPLPMPHPDTLLTGLTVLKGLLALAAVGAVSWRLRRRASSGLRAAYFAGAWAMAIGVGLVADHDGVLAGSLCFDAGLAVLLAAALRDASGRREKPSPGTPA